jgi:Ca-activated chloride channel family protein
VLTLWGGQSYPQPPVVAQARQNPHSAFTAANRAVTKGSGLSTHIFGNLAVPLALAMFFLLIARAHAQSAPGPYQISVNVDLVVLHPTVRDGKSRFISDLLQPDFQVYEDGVRQTIQSFQHEDVPVTVGLVVDHSGSMQPKLRDVIAAARTFVHSSNPEDQMFVVNFNEHVTLGLPAAIPFTHASDELERAISKMPAAGQTALYDAIVQALDRLKAGAWDKKVLIVISDGGDNKSAQTLESVLQVTERSSALIYTVGLFSEDDGDANPKVLSRLALATGGDAFFPQKLDDVVTICERIARDIRSQYTIGYVSMNNRRNGAHRSIRVAAQAPGRGKLVVRARAGYIAGSESRLAKDEGK